MIEGSGSVPILMDPDPGGPKTYRYDGSGSATLSEYTLNVGTYRLQMSMDDGSCGGCVVANKVRQSVIEKMRRGN